MRDCCKKMRRRGGRACSLRDLPAGRRARILQVLCGDEQRLRLCSLGLTPGTPVEACGCFPGMCRLLVRGSALALDGELAGQVLCEEE